MRFMKILEEVNSLPDYLFHVTPEENLKDIKKNGLQAQKSESSSEGVYLSDDEFTAANYASMRRHVDHVLLKINTSYLNEDKFGPDDYELEDFLERNNWEVEGRYYDSVYDLTWKQSLKYVNQLVYYDDVPVESIEIVESKFIN